MTISATEQPPVVSVLGNPNTGKSTLFNLLTGVHQQTGNYPGVTVEKRMGKFEAGGREFQLIDLPGLYSLAPRSPDEMVAVNVLMGRPPADREPDLILCVVDANNLERNLFLVSQVLDFHRPTVVALNMSDVAERKGLVIDAAKLSQLLGIPVIPISAKKKTGISELRDAIAKTLDQNPLQHHDPFSSELASRIDRLEDACPDNCSLKRVALTRMLFDIDGFMEKQLGEAVAPALSDAIESEKQQMASAGQSLAQSESHARYAWLRKHLPAIVRRTGDIKPSKTDRADRLLTHPVWGLAAAAITMLILFQLVFRAAEPASHMIDGLKVIAESWVDLILADGAFNSLLKNGLIAGVGGVLVFLPQIAVLFLVLAVLEDSGYLARAAFLTDKYLSRLGISGIALIPLLSSFACAIPGIMATRVIKNERERLITILIAPLMSCSARLPVYALMIAAFVPNRSFLGGWIGLQGLTMLAMYLLGIVVAILVALVLRKTILRTGSSIFVMELPAYKSPSLRNIWHRVFEGSWAFIRDAGTIIVLFTIVVWAAAYFPRNANSLPPGLIDQRSQLTETLGSADGPSTGSVKRELALVQNQIDAAYLESSYLGRAGKLIEPVVEPLGWDWRIGSAAIASFPAREVVVSTMGVIFGMGSEEDGSSPGFEEQLKSATWAGSDRPLFTLPVALSIMVFFALCAQCVSTLAVIRRETNSNCWPIFTFFYMTILAYVAALATFQIANLFA